MIYVEVKDFKCKKCGSKEYAVKILAILNGTSQKEIKSRLEEVKKRVA